MLTTHPRLPVMTIAMAWDHKQYPNRYNPTGMAVFIRCIYIIKYTYIIYRYTFKFALFLTWMNTNKYGMGALLLGAAHICPMLRQRSALPAHALS